MHSDTVFLADRLKFTVFERGWLSSNNVLFQGSSENFLIDTGYCSHSDLTLQLVQSKLIDQPLHGIVNTHLHSDHCGGNACLQSQYPDVLTYIPVGQSEHVRNWDPVRLSFVPTGQNCPSFNYTNTIQRGDFLQLGDQTWQVFSSPGHDLHSVILFEPQYKVLISADALWRNGFGVVFDELDGKNAFQEVEDTLNLIESLQPNTVIPGHGSVFHGCDVNDALAIARSKLTAFRNSPLKHTRYAVKVLLKYKLLEWQRISMSDMEAWTLQTPYFSQIHKQYFPHLLFVEWIVSLINDLIESDAAKFEHDMLINV